MGCMTENCYSMTGIPDGGMKEGMILGRVNHESFMTVGEIYSKYMLVFNPEDGITGGLYLILYIPKISLL